MATTTEYAQYLPAAFFPDAESSRFLVGFLDVIHRVLTGPGPGEGADGAPPGIEQLLDGIHTYFMPGTGLPEDQRAPEEFLPWLASWVATSLREDWSAETKRKFIQKVPALYARRGTLDCMQQLLTFFLNDLQKPPIVQEDWDRPYHFLVRLRVNTPSDVPRCKSTAHYIIEREKPAHTDYDLIIESPRMQIVDLPARGGILLGVNTHLGIDDGLSKE